MLGPAELREIYDCLKGMGLEPVRVAKDRSPYLNPALAAGMAATKAVSAVVKSTLPATADVLLAKGRPQK